MRSANCGKLQGYYSIQLSCWKRAGLRVILERLLEGIEVLRKTKGAYVRVCMVAMKHQEIGVAQV